MWGPRVRAGPDRGSATVEAAIALGAMIVVFGLLLAGVSLAVEQIQCTSAANEAARLVARGERSLAESTVHSIVSDDAAVDVRQHGRGVTVTVRSGSSSVLLPGIGASARAYAELEPGVAVSGEPGPSGGSDSAKVTSGRAGTVDVVP